LECGTKSFETAFKDAYLHFSHYGKANDQSPFRQDYAWALWLRGTAVTGQPRQKLVDRASPIFFKSYETVSAEAMSWNLDQDKTSPSITPAHVAVQSAESLNLFLPGHKTTLPYISAVHCYALKHDIGLSARTPTDKTYHHQEENQQAPRYQIDFLGLAAYQHLESGVKDKILAVINGSQQYLFSAHPRQDEVPALHQLQPYLDEDPATTKWFGKLKLPELPVA
jgi:hypothetical protein